MYERPSSFGNNSNVDTFTTSKGLKLEIITDHYEFAAMPHNSFFNTIASKKVIISGVNRSIRNSCREDEYDKICEVLKYHDFNTIKFECSEMFATIYNSQYEIYEKIPSFPQDAIYASWENTVEIQEHFNCELMIFDKIKLSNYAAFQNSNIRNIIFDLCASSPLNFLVFLKNPNLKSIRLENDFYNINNRVYDIKKLSQIINSYLRLPKENRNILACQDELLENGFKIFAKLK